MKNNSLYNKTLALLLVFSMVIMPFNTISYAEDVANTTTESTTDDRSIIGVNDSIDKEETPLNKNYDKGWQGFYENFIIDLGAVRLTFYNGANKVKEVNVLSKQFEGTTSYGVTKPMLDGEKDVILRGTRPQNVNISGYKFSNNIPVMTPYYDSNDTKLAYVFFELWSNAKPFKDWIDEEKGSNLLKLVEDIGMSEDAIFEGGNVESWLGKGNSIVLEPLTFYGVSNEEIQASDKTVANTEGLTYSLSVFLDAISEADELNQQNISSEDKIAIKNGTYSGNNTSILRFLGRRLYYHCGFLDSEDMRQRKMGNYDEVGEELTQVKRYFQLGQEYVDEFTKEFTSKWKRIFVEQLPNEIQEIGTDKLANSIASNTALTTSIRAIMGRDLTNEEIRAISKQITSETAKKIGKLTHYEELMTFAVDLGTGNATEFNQDYWDKKVSVEMKNKFWDTMFSAFEDNDDDNNSPASGAGANKIPTEDEYYEQMAEENLAYEQALAEHEAAYNAGTTTEGNANEATKQSLIEKYKQVGDIIYGNNSVEKQIQKMIKDHFDIIVAGALSELNEVWTILINAALKGAGIALTLLTGEENIVHYDETVGQYYVYESIRTTNAHFIALSYTDTLSYSKAWVSQSGLDFLFNSGKDTKIISDHNKYFSVIPKSDNEKVKPIQDVLVSASILKNEDPMRWGSAMICGQAVLGDEILIKFHSNLEQISDSTGSIDPEYNLYAQIGSSEYTWQKDGTKVTKFPFTYPQDIASAYKNDEGESYEYSSYGTIKQTEKGEQVGGKRFTVNKSKMLTQDMVDSALGKQASIDKKSSLDAVKAAIGADRIYTNQNSAKNKLGDVVSRTISGKTYYISEDDATAWDNAIEDYNTKNADKTEKYTDPATGKTYTIIILYVDWIFTGTDGQEGEGRELILYEDELSYVYDYDDIGNDNTRKLTNTVQYEGNGFHSRSMGGSCPSSPHMCYDTTSGTFTLSVKHTLEGADYNNIILSEQQSSIGDTNGPWASRGLYTVNAQEKGQLPFLTGRDINHEFVGYRDKSKDLRTNYNSSSGTGSLNSSNVNTALGKYNINDNNYKPVTADWLGSKEINDTISANYEFDLSGSTNYCSNHGSHTWYCGGCECEPDEDGDEHCSCPGHDCSYYCGGGECYSGLDTGPIPQSNIKNVYNDNRIKFKQYSYVGQDESVGDSQFPSQDNANLNVLTKGDNTSNTEIEAWSYNGHTYDNNTEFNGQVIGTYNTKDLGEIEFYPFIKMRYKDTLTGGRNGGYEYAYVLAQNKTSMKNFAIAQVSMEDIGTSGARSNKANGYTINLEAQWDGWSETMKGLAENGIEDLNSVIHGGSIVSLSTSNTDDGVLEDKTQDCNIGIDAYVLAVPDDLTSTILTDRSQYYTVSEAKEELERFINDIKLNLGHYQLEKWVAKGIYTAEEEDKFINDATCVYGLQGIQDKFDGRTLTKNGKYYFNEKGDNASDNNTPTIDIIDDKSDYTIQEFRIKSDLSDNNIHSNIKLYIDDTEVDSINSQNIKPNNNYDENRIQELLTNDDWRRLNNVTAFVDNYIKALEMNTDGGHTRNNSRPGWYCEGQDGLSVIRLQANIRLGLDDISDAAGRTRNGNSKIFEVSDPALCGSTGSKYNSRDWSNPDKSIRTIQYRMSPQFRYVSGDNSGRDGDSDSEPGYIGSIGKGDSKKELKVYFDNIDYTFRSKLIYQDNVTVDSD